MTTFIVRFQLEAGTLQDYERLRNLLINAGFSKKIQAKDGRYYFLPQGEYIGETNKSRDEVLQIAAANAAKIRRRYKVLVIESAPHGCAWINLSPA